MASIDSNRGEDISKEESEANLNQALKDFQLDKQQQQEKQQTGFRKLLSRFQRAGNTAEQKVSQGYNKLSQSAYRGALKTLGSKQEIARYENQLKKKQQADINKLTRSFKEKQYSEKIQGATSEEKRLKAEEKLKRFQEKEQLKQQKALLQDKYTALSLKPKYAVSENRKYQKWRYRRDSSGRIIGKYGISGHYNKSQGQVGQQGKLRTAITKPFMYETAEGQRVNLRLNKQEYRTLRQAQTRLKRDLSFDEINNLGRFTAMQQLRKAQEQAQENLPYDNPFLIAQRDVKSNYDKQQLSRLRNKLPTNHHQILDQLRQQALFEEREFQRQNSLLKSHENMHKVNFDVLSEQDNILKAENLFSQNNMNNVNLFKPTGRPSILQTGDNNIMAQRPDSINIMGTSNNILQNDNNILRPNNNLNFW